MTEDTTIQGIQEFLKEVREEAIFGLDNIDAAAKSNVSDLASGLRAWKADVSESFGASFAGEDGEALRITSNALLAYIAATLLIKMAVIISPALALILLSLVILKAGQSAFNLYSQMMYKA